MIKIKNIVKKILPVADIFVLPLVYTAALLLKLIRRVGVNNMPYSKAVFMKIGVFPIINHYYEPLFNTQNLSRPLNQVRSLPGIDFNEVEQIALLEKFNFNDEFKLIDINKTDELRFHINNSAFASGDAEYFYNLIRFKKPSRIYEIGSGLSTLLAIQAIQKNKDENSTYTCEHLCIEPYEMPWLEKAGVKVIRNLVENVDKSLFLALEENDILFIDSSHIIRPQGDVLYEYLELLPILKVGVIVHVHDIFSPRDYLKEWIVDEVKFWNEQYLLEAFLTANKEWKVIGALNFLHHRHFDKLKKSCPFLSEEREPGSFYIQKII